MLIFFWIVFAIDAAAAAVALYFFFVGLGDGSVSAFNIVLWLALLGGIAAILGGGLGLHASGRRGAAIGVLAILGIPAFLYGLFILLLVILQPSWH